MCLPARRGDIILLEVKEEVAVHEGGHNGMMKDLEKRYRRRGAEIKA